MSVWVDRSHKIVYTSTHSSFQQRKVGIPEPSNIFHIYFSDCLKPSFGVLKSGAGTVGLDESL